MNSRGPFFPGLRRLTAAVALAVCYFAVANVKPAPASPVATTRFVAATGTDAPSCSSSASPCRTIQYAVNQSATGDTIRVAQGTYTYSTANDICSFLGTPTVVCVVDKALTIVGGYSAGNWSTSNPSANVTVIDGQNAYRGVHVLQYGAPAYLDMEGFTIQNGRAQGPRYKSSPYIPDGLGGGMWASNAAVTLKDMIFKNNRAVGANTTSGAGGAAAGAGLVIEQAPAGSLLERVTFEGNQSQGGVGPERGGVAFGALFTSNSTVTANYITFTNNQAIAGNSSGSGQTSDSLNADALGGAAGFEGGSVALQHITATGNKATGGNASTSGGNAFGGGIFAENVDSFSMSDSYVANNISQGESAINAGLGAGGGVSLTNTPSSVARVQLISNSVIGANSTTAKGLAGAAVGGGLYTFATHTGVLGTFTNLIVADNSATMGTLGSTQQGGGGGGIAVQGQQANITHTTIARNRLGSTLVAGQGLLVLEQPFAAALIPASANVNYTTIADHTVGSSRAVAVLVKQSSTVTFNRGLFAGNTKDTNADGLPMPAGTFNGLSTMLKSSSAGFFSPGSPNYNYHLRLDSAAKDQATGSAATDDVDAQARPHGNGSDIGADEYWPFPLSVFPGNSSLQLDWTQGASLLAGGVSHYEILVTCPAGASSQGACGTFGVGAVTSFKLTGLTNSKQYTLLINAKDAAGNLIATSITATGTPTDKFIALPLILK